MANLILPGKRIVQPQVAARLKPEYAKHSLLSVPLIDGFTDRLHQYEPAVSGTVVYGATKFGKCVNLSSSGYLSYPSFTHSKFTIIVTISPIGTSSAGGVFLKRNKLVGYFDNANASNEIWLRYDSASSTVACAIWTTVTSDDANIIVPGLSSGGVANIVVTFGGIGTPVRIFVNGVEGTPSSNSSGTLVAGLALTQLGASSGNVTTRFYNGSIANAHFLNTVVPNPKELSANPWQIFEPQKSVVYFDVGAGGGEITGSFSATETDTDTFAAAGDVVVSGTLATTEVGIDTFAASGAAIATGDLIAAETGADTFAATGDVVVSGTLSVSETGTDTFSATGNVVVSGTLAATETGADTFAATGNVIVSGTLAATETGTDTFTSTGSVLVEGTLAATETGTDTFFAVGGNVSTGSLAATESAADTFAASGSVLIEGTLAASEGADSFSASGNVIIAGTLTVSETGNDTFSAFGGAVIAGTLSASETGSDTFAASGTQVSTGALSATESADTFSASGTSIITGTLAATELSDIFAATGDVVLDGVLAVIETGADTFLAYDPGTAPTSTIADTQWSIIVKQYDFRAIVKERRKDILIK